MERSQRKELHSLCCAIEWNGKVHFNLHMNKHTAYCRSNDNGNEIHNLNAMLVCTHETKEYYVPLYAPSTLAI